MAQVIIWFKSEKKAIAYRDQHRPGCVVLPTVTGEGYGVFPA